MATILNLIGTDLPECVMVGVAAGILIVSVTYLIRAAVKFFARIVK